MGFDEQVVQTLRDALVHLYDPAYRPADDLWALTGCDPQRGVEHLQERLIAAIKALEPAPSVPQTARIRRIYDVLHDRYVRQLTQEETAARLGITPRHLRREQKEALEVLAQRLGGRPVAAASSTDIGAGEGEIGVDVPSPAQPASLGARSTAWRSQVQEELASLRESAVGAVADVEETMRGVIALETALVSSRGIDLEVERLEPGLSVAIHPTALRQVLIAAIGELSDRMPFGRIVLSAAHQGKNVGLSIAACPIEAGEALDGGLVEEIVAAQGGSVETEVEGNTVSLRISLPSVDKVTVLVVDDNVDLVHFYRRYTTGTRYHIVHTANGGDVLGMLDTVAPDVIVLDVMLPDIDGWELLIRLHEDPTTRSIPIVVCSVVREEALALSLGATLYLAKPVRRREFVLALDRASSRIPT